MQRAGCRLRKALEPTREGMPSSPRVPALPGVPWAVPSHHDYLPLGSVLVTPSPSRPCDCLPRPPESGSPALVALLPTVPLGPGSVGSEEYVDGTGETRNSRSEGAQRRHITQGRLSGVTTSVDSPYKGRGEKKGGPSPPGTSSGRLPSRGPRFSSPRPKARLGGRGPRVSSLLGHSAVLPHAHAAGPEPHASPFRPQLSLMLSTCWVTDHPAPRHPGIAAGKADTPAVG